MCSEFLLSWPTFARLVVDADGLGLILAILPLNTYKVGIRGLIEARPEGQHVLIGLVYSFYELYVKQERLRRMIKCEELCYLILPRYIWWLESLCRSSELLDPQ